jgi:hypothetical protein
MFEIEIQRNRRQSREKRPSRTVLAQPEMEEERFPLV